MRTPTIVAAAAVLIAASVAVPAAAAHAAGTTYYIDNGSGSGCSDAGSGTSAATPWCTFTPANAHRTFAAGDKILLARGATWNQQLSLTGSGAAGSVIELGAYGSGPRPVISRTGAASDRAVRIDNASFWLIHDLELSNAGEGLLMYYDTTLHQDVTIDDLYVHGISGIHQGNYSGTDQAGAADGIWNSSGIGFTGVVPSSMPDTDYMVKNVTVRGVEGTDNQSSVALDWFNGERRASGSTGANNVQNVVFDSLSLHDDDGAGRSVGCDEGMRIVSATSILMTDSALVDEGACHSATGTAAMLIGRVKNLTVENSLFDTVPNTSSPDQVAVDYEYLEDTAVFRNTVFRNIAGSALSYLNIHSGDSDTGAVSSGNTFIGSGEASHRQDGTVAALPTGSISNDLFFEPNQFLKPGGNYSGFAFSDNQASGSASDVSAASVGFGATQGANNWSYQYWTGSAWADLGYYDPTLRIWQLSSSANVPQVGAFDMHPAPGAAGLAARTWTAPHEGVVSIRGLVLKAGRSLGGDGVLASVTLNGTQIWPASGQQSIGGSDQTGYHSDIDQLTVSTGDQIRFVVSPGSAGDNSYDLTSWSPTVAYVSWEFPTAGDTQLWHALNQATVSSSGGSLTIANTGADPYLGSGPLAIDASKYTHIQLRLTNSTPGTTAEFFFATATAGGWSSAREVPVTVAANAGATTYTFDMGANANWTGLVTGLRFDPPGASGSSSSVDWIRIQP